MKRKNKKANLAIYIGWVFSAIILVVIAGLVAPMGTKFNTEMFRAGEKILQDNQAAIDNISNEEVRQSLNASTTKALANTELNINVTNNIYQYAWLIALVLSAVIAFLIARQIAEVQQYGGGGLI